jgi:hypothetical protein
MQSTKILPVNYRQQASLDLSKNKKAIVGAIILGIVLLIVVGWLLMQFISFLRPSALVGLKFGNILTLSPNGKFSVVLPIPDIFIALFLVMLIHELVHGAFYWYFTYQRPIFGIKGLSFYSAASPNVYIPRNQYLIVGVAPFVLLTLVGLLLLLYVQVFALSIISLFIIFNAAGAAGDLVMAIRFLSYPPNTFMQDHNTGVVVFGPEKFKSIA